MLRKQLQHARALKCSIDAIQDQICELRTLAENVCPQPWGGGYSPVARENMAMAVEAIVDYQAELGVQVQQLIEAQRTARTQIAAFEDLRYRQLLELYYVQAFTWEEVALRMNYTARHVLRMHRALWCACETGRAPPVSPGDAQAAEQKGAPTEQPVRLPQMDA